MTLPLKTGILKYAIDNKKGFRIEDIMRDLNKDYYGEKIFKKSIIENYIFAFCSVRMLEADDISFDNNGELNVTYKITDFGLQNKKYLPEYGN